MSSKRKASSSSSATAILLSALFVIFVWTPLPSDCILEEIATGLEVIVHAVESIQQTWEIVEATDVLKQKDQHANPNIKNMVSRKHHELMGRLVEIYRAIENVEHDVSWPYSWQYYLSSAIIVFGQHFIYMNHEVLYSRCARYLLAEYSEHLHSRRSPRELNPSNNH